MVLPNLPRLLPHAPRLLRAVLPGPLHVPALAPSFTGAAARAAAGSGAWLGAVAMAKVRVKGDVLGISGIVGGLTKPGVATDDLAERIAFLAGLLLAGARPLSFIFRKGAPRSR